MEQVYIGGVLIAGLLSFFSPCILPILPVYLAYLSGIDPGSSSSVIKLGKLRLHPVLIGNTLFFILGLATVFILLGFGAGALGIVINNSWFIIVCGIIVIIFGLYHIGLFRLLFMERELRWSFASTGRKGFIGAFLLGFTFSFGWTPCIGPVLAAVLSIAASEGSTGYGGWMMFIYTLGMAIPFLLLSVFSDLMLQRLKKIYRYMAMLKVISGILLIIMGVLLMTNQLHIITNFFTIK